MPILCRCKHAGRAYGCGQTLDARWSRADVRLTPTEQYSLPETLDETLAPLASFCRGKGGVGLGEDSPFKPSTFVYV